MRRISFNAWYTAEHRPAVLHEGDCGCVARRLEARGLGPISINVRITAVRKRSRAQALLNSPDTAAAKASFRGECRAHRWRRLKALVLDSVSSPITRRVYNLGWDEFIAPDGEGTLGSRDVRGPFRLRAALVGSGRAHDETDFK